MPSRTCEEAPKRIWREADTPGGFAHLVGHMLFKGTASRAAEDIDQAIGPIRGQHEEV